MNRNLTLSLGALLSLIVSGCSKDISSTGGDDDDNGPKVSTVDNGDGSFTTTVEAGYIGADTWVYFSFASKDEVKVTREDWDLAFKFADIMLNGGTSGTGGMELVAVDGGDYDAVTQAPASGWITDADPDFAFETGDGWYTYDINTHAMSLNDRYYVVKRTDGQYVKLKMVNFTNDAGTPGYPAFLWEAVAAP